MDVLQLDRAVAALLRKCTETPWLAYMRQVSLTVCELFLPEL